ncbi:hypothetical protein KQX54_000717 [Cotesia glomerata]|uniref:RING-type E3 ubiquitin transferase n=1 Tax=Cotesia glomerata TaxID=32391 RepID=A0AAV7IEV1_COTGL|nr:hypothetical protein KQX54_000717 [Cotesia glomerata]
MRYSRKEYCELCGHRFSFTPIYSPDMPRRLPLKDVVGGLFSSVVTAVSYWFHYTLVALAWLGLVPLTACRTYRALFSGSLDLVRIMSLPMDMLSLDNISSDVFHGCFVVTCTLFAFIGLVWLREQILHAGGPDWLERNVQQLPAAGNNQAAVGQQQVQDLPGQPEVRGDNNNVPPFVDEPPRLADGNDDEQPMYREVADNSPNNAVAAEAEEPNNENENPEEAQGDGAAVGWRGQVQDQAQVPGEAEEANWNPMEWDRPAEELTWERLLGLDGSLLFLEHVFWVISLNTVFILVFAFALTPSGLVTTLCGYGVIGAILVILHTIAALFGLQRSQRVLGLGYVVVKVSLLSVVEIGVLPLVCGWWLDICSLAMFDATLKDRESSFRLAPGTCMFIHWLVGMVYIYYFASFILLLREVLRPGVLWFLRNLNDPDFSPIQEMIHLPILQHALEMGMAWVFTYTVTVQTESQVSELSLELLLLQVILPALLEQSHTRTWLKALIRGWCQAVAWILDLQSYLLRDQRDDQGPAVIEEPQHPGLGAAHQAAAQQAQMLHRDIPTGYQPYVRTKWFPARLVGLLICVCISLVIASLIAMTLPVWLGRRVMALWMVGAPAPSPPVLPPTLSVNSVGEAMVVFSGRVHEIYTVACGTYVCWAAARGLALALSWLPRGRRAILDRIKHWAIVSVRASIAFVLLVGVIPLLFGLLLELVVVVPLRVPLEQNPILFIWQDWALGVLYTKIATAVIMMGPEWRLRTAIEKAYNDGVREMDLKFIIKEIAAPVICVFGLALAVPYAFLCLWYCTIIRNKFTNTNTDC